MPDGASELELVAHRDFRVGQWGRAAARRSDMKDAAQGIDEAVSGALVRKFTRQGNKNMVGALRCVLVGGTWPRLRRARAGLCSDGTCAKCGEADEFDLHRWWICPGRKSDRTAAGVEDLAAAGAAAGF